MASSNKKAKHEPLPKEVREVVYSEYNGPGAIERVIQQHMVKRPKGLKENLIFFFRHAPAGLLIYFINYCWITLFIFLGLTLVGFKINFWESLGVVVFIRGVKIAWEMAKDKHINDEEELGK